MALDMKGMTYGLLLHLICRKQYFEQIHSTMTTKDYLWMCTLFLGGVCLLVTALFCELLHTHGRITIFGPYLTTHCDIISFSKPDIWAKSQQSNGPAIVVCIYILHCFAVFAGK
jgi:hypothetical protein